MSKWVATWLGLLWACGVAAGCRSSSDESQPVSQDELASKLAQVRCDSFAGCCASAHFTFDATNCVGATKAVVQHNLDDEMSLNVQYDAVAAGDCVAATRDQIRCGELESAIPACSHIFVGTLAAGEACTDSEECKPPGYCRQDVVVASGTFQSTCVVDNVSGQTFRHGKTGDVCDGSCSDSGKCFFTASSAASDNASEAVGCYRSDGLFCDDAASTRDITTATGQCKPLLGLGESCTAENCEAGLYCELAQGVYHCAAPHPDGATCQDNNQCQSNNCELADGSSSGMCATHSVTQTDCANGGS